MEQLRDDEVLRDVRELVSQRRIRYKVHAETRMEERGYDKSQVAECLAKGWFSERPHISNRPGPIEYKFCIEANVDGDVMRVAAALRPSDSVIVITVI